MHAVVVAGSTLEGPLDGEILARADLVLAADGGADALLGAGYRPHVLVGDMDSVTEDALRIVRRAGVEVVLLAREKDETDLEVALRLAVERGASRLTVFGALGGPRLDHLVATMLLLTAPWLEGKDVRLVDPWHEVFLSAGDVTVQGGRGDTLSLLPLTPKVEGITTEGLLYPLRDESLYQRAARGVSNELVAEEARVRHRVGNLLVIHYRRERKPHVHFETDAHGPGLEPLPQHQGKEAAATGQAAGQTADRLETTACQFSVYPLRRERIGDVVEEVIAAAAAQGVTVRVQNLSTLMYGEEERVFAALRAAYRAAQARGSAVIVATLAGGLPSDEEVSRIQEERAKGEGRAEEL